MTTTPVIVASLVLIPTWDYLRYDTDFGAQRDLGMAQKSITQLPD